MDALRYWPTPNSFPFAFIHLDTIASDYVTPKELPYEYGRYNS